MKQEAEARREAIRQANDALILKGSQVYDVIFGIGEVISIHKKSYRIKFSGEFICARDKSYIKPL